MRPNKLSPSEVRRRVRLIPRTLELYLTNRCNLDCTYCSTKVFGHGCKGVRALGFEDIRRGLDEFICWTDPKLRKYAGLDGDVSRSVCFSGGEPMLEFEMLLRIVDYIRAKAPWMGASVSTNAVLLDRKKLRALEARGVCVMVSVDGCRPATDLNRKFYGSDSSVFDTVVKNLRRLPEKSVKRMHVMATVTPQAVKWLPESIEFLEGFGFGSVDISVEAYRLWSPRDLELLRAALREFRRRRLGKRALPASAEETGKFLALYFEDELGSRQQDKPTVEFSLSPEGFFFPCGIMTRVESGTGRPYVIGDIEHGFDFKKIETLYARVAACLRKSDYPNSMLAAIDRYCYALMEGLDPEEAVRNGALVCRIFEEELGVVFETKRLSKELIRSRDFGGFGHRPKYFGRKPGARLGLEAGAGTRVLREAADYSLYSPGKRLELAINKRDGRGGEKLLVFYSLLEAARLGKSVSVDVRARLGDLTPGYVGFIGGHGARLGIR